MKYSKCLLYSLSYYATHIIHPSLNSRISANHGKVKELSASNGEILKKRMHFSNFWKKKRIKDSLNVCFFYPKLVRGCLDFSYINQRLISLI